MRNEQGEGPNDNSREGVNSDSREDLRPYEKEQIPAGHLQKPASSSGEEKTNIKYI